MAVLTDEIKTFIVMSLACFDTPTEVAAAVGEKFGVKIDRFQAHAYDPACQKRPAKRWLDLHDATRKAFLKETAGVAAAHRAVRVRKLARMAEKAETRGNMVLAAQLLEQIAKEMGESYTNKIKLAGPTGGPVQFQRVKTGIDRE
jgi:hypothetical protein